MLTTKEKINIVLNSKEFNDLKNSGDLITLVKVPHGLLLEDDMDAFALKSTLEANEPDYQFNISTDRKMDAIVIKRRVNND